MPSASGPRWRAADVALGVGKDVEAGVAIGDPDDPIQVLVEEEDWEGKGPYKTLSLQKLNGGVAVRHKLDSAKAKALIKRYPELQALVDAATTPEPDKAA